MTSVGIEALNAMLGPLCLFQNRDRDCEEEAVIAAPFVAFLCLCLCL